MKNIIYITIVSIFFASCDTKLDPIKFKDADPVFTINKGLNAWNNDNEFVSIFTDSVKVNRTYLIEYKLEDESNTLVTEVINNNIGVFKLDDINLNDIEGLPNGQKTLTFTSSNLGTHQLGIKVLDNYNQFNEVSFDLTIFYNLLPKANFTVVKNNINQQYQYLIDGSNSFDQDAKYGGGILQYQLIVNTDTLTSNNPMFDYYFANSGTYTIGMRILDNDEKWGEIKQISYNVN